MCVPISISPLLVLPTDSYRADVIAICAFPDFFSLRILLLTDYSVSRRSRRNYDRLESLGSEGPDLRLQVLYGLHPRERVRVPLSRCCLHLDFNTSSRRHALGLIFSAQPLTRFCIDPNAGGATHTVRAIFASLPLHLSVVDKAYLPSSQRPGLILSHPTIALGQIFSILFGGLLVFVGFDTLASKYVSFVRPPSPTASRRPPS